MWVNTSLNYSLLIDTDIRIINFALMQNCKLNCELNFLEKIVSKAVYNSFLFDKSKTFLLSKNYFELFDEEKFVK